MLKKAQLIFRLFLFAWIIYGIYRDLHSQWLTIFCSLIALTFELDTIIVSRLNKLKEEIDKIKSGCF